MADLFRSLNEKLTVPGMNVTTKFGLAVGLWGDPLVVGPTLNFSYSGPTEGTPMACTDHDAIHPSRITTNVFITAFLFFATTTRETSQAAQSNKINSTAHSLQITMHPHLHTKDNTGMGFQKHYFLRCQPR